MAPPSCGMSAPSSATSRSLRKGRSAGSYPALPKLAGSGSTPGRFVRSSSASPAAIVIPVRRSNSSTWRGRMRVSGMSSRMPRVTMPPCAVVTASFEQPPSSVTTSAKSKPLYSLPLYDTWHNASMCDRFRPW